MVSNANDTTLKAILKYRSHSSITAIQNKCKDKNSFNFIEVDQKQIEKEILELDVNKASQSSNIPIKVVKEITDIFSNFLCNSFDDSVKLSTFPEILKHADITPLYKKAKKDIKGNYIPVNILQNYQKYLKHAQFYENIFSKYLCGFRKGFSTQELLLAISEKWKRSANYTKMFGALFTELSKFFE